MAPRSRDYYSVLEIPRDAMPADIRAAYRRLALKWLPGKHPNAREESQQRFRDISEAYDVLIHPTWRETFDEYGEHGLKFPPSDSGLHPYQYVTDPLVPFKEFFAENSPLAAVYQQDYEGRAPGLDDRNKEEPTVVDVTCTAAELKEGAFKRIRVPRVRLGPSGKPFNEGKLITVPIRAGWIAGMSVRFKEEGNHTVPENRAGDLVFMLREGPAQSGSLLGG